MPSRTDRAVAALLGVHAGDSLGAALEFSPWAEIRQRYPDGLRDIVGGGPFGWAPGDPTDDTDLTRAVLLAYVEPGDDVVRTAAGHMVSWLDGDWPGREPGVPPRDAGRATLLGLGRFRETGDPRAAGAGPGQAGNGSLMRCLPTAVAVRDRDRRLRDSREISAITHDDPRCTAACAAYNELAAALLDGAAPDAAVTAAEATLTDAAPTAGEAARAPGGDGRGASDAGAADVLGAIRLGREVSLPELVEAGPGVLPDRGGGFVLDSLTLAVAAVLDPRPMEDVLVDVVRLGGDTDTNGAIAGGLLGARDGAVPEHWTAVLRYTAEFTAAATALTS